MHKNLKVIVVTAGTIFVAIGLIRFVAFSARVQTNNTRKAAIETVSPVTANKRGATLATPLSFQPKTSLAKQFDFSNLTPQPSSPFAFLSNVKALSGASVQGWSQDLADGAGWGRPYYMALSYSSDGIFGLLSSTTLCYSTDPAFTNLPPGLHVEQDCTSTLYVVGTPIWNGTYEQKNYKIGVVVLNVSHVDIDRKVFDIPAYFPPTLFLNNQTIAAGSTIKHVVLGEVKRGDYRYPMVKATATLTNNLTVTPKVKVENLSFTPKPNSFAVDVLEADVTVYCNEANFTFNVVATDSRNVSNTANFNVNVVADIPPILTYNSLQSVAYGGSLTLKPTQFSDNGTITSLQADSLFYQGQITAAPDGTITLQNHSPGGRQYIGVSAVDNCGLRTNTSFALDIPCQSTDVVLPDMTLPTATVGSLYASYPNLIKASGNSLSAQFEYSLISGTLPPGISLDFVSPTSQGVNLIGLPTAAGTYNFTLRAATSSGCNTTHTYTVTVLGPPTITPVSVSQQAKTTANNVLLARLAADSQAVNTLGIKINNGTSATVNGVSISNLQISPAGDLTGTVVTDCPTTATFTLQASDVKPLSTTATITVRVTPSPNNPTIGAYAAQTLEAFGTATITPSAAPTYASSVAVSASGFAGQLSVNSTTGVILVTNAQPPGIYPVTVVATANCGVQTSTTFNLIVRSSGTCGNTAFQKSSHLNIGEAAYAVAVGDFNLDGKPDVATGEQANNFRVRIWLGDGSGNFTEAPNSTITTALSGIEDIKVGDFNGDGKPDLAAINSYQVYVLLGTGTGSFTAASGSPITLASGTTSVAIGDLNLDGKQDLVIGRATSGMYVLLGNGAGGFTAASGSPISASSTKSVRVADFNGDGKPDIVAANTTDNTVSVWLGNGTGNFTAGTTVTIGDDPFSLTVGDYNGDAKPDIAIANRLANVAHILLNRGDATFTVPTSIALPLTYPYKIETGDFNGDGLQDLLVGHQTGNSVAILLGDGSGNFTVSPFRGGPTPGYALAVGDFNNDHRQDFVVAGAQGGDATSYFQGVSFWLNTCNRLPLLASNAVSRVAGLGGSNTLIGNASDQDEAATSLALRINNAAGATVNGVTITNLTINGAGEIYADVTAACGATSTDFTLKVTDTAGGIATANLRVTVTDAIPNITTQPLTQLLHSRQDASFSISASGLGTLTYQWRKNGINLSESTKFQGTTSPTLLVKAPTAVESGIFTVVVSNGCKSVTSAQAELSNVAPVAGRVRGLNFPGANESYISVTKEPQLENYTSVTVETWVKLSSASGRYDIINKAPLFFGIQNGLPSVYLQGLSNPGFHSSSTPIPIGVWTHIAVTYDGNLIKIFVNGIENYSGAATGNIPNLNSPPLVIGKCVACTPAGFAFLGQLDEVRLWSVARTNTQLQANLYRGLTGQESGLVAYWRADELTGVIANDATGHGFDGTIYGTVTRPASDSFSVDEDTVLTGNLFAYDKNDDDLTYQLVSQASKGTVTITNAVTGAFRYQPKANANGADNFTFKVNDGGLVSNVAAVTIIINPVNDTLTVVNGTPPSLNQGQAANLVLATVTDVDLPVGNLVMTASSIPSGITLTNLNNANGVITADVFVDCAASLGGKNLVLTVSNANNTTATINLPITVTDAVAVNYPAVVSTFPNKSITVSPLSVGSDITNISFVSAVPALTVAPTIDSQGNVTITSDNIQGNYVIKVQATNRCGKSSEKSFIVSVAASCVLNPPQLAHWYRGEGNVLDKIVNGINGAVTGGVTYAPGKVGNAFVFPGDGSNVTLTAAHHLTNNFSVEFWVKPARFAGDQYLIGSPDYGVFGALFLAGDRVAFGATAHQNLVSSPLLLQQWSHVVMTSDETHWRLYVNGILVSSAPREDGVIVPARKQGNSGNTNKQAAQSVNGTNVSESAQDTLFSFGAGVALDAWNGGQPFQGMMDEISIYDRNLADNEIAQLYSVGALGKCSSPLGAVTPQAVALSAGTTNNNALMAVVAKANALTVNALAVPAGITLNNLQSANGNVTADITTNCSTTAGVNYLRLQIKDGANLSDTVDVPVTITANSLAITTQPVSASVCQGGSIALSVAANSNGAVSYQWRKNGTIISGATANSLHIANAAPSDIGNYDVVISNACTSITSQPATVSIAPQLAVTTAPVDRAVTAGQSATFSAAASDSNAKVQWQVSMNSGQFWTDVRGATTSTLSFPANAAQDGNRYRAVFTNCSSSVSTSEARLTVSNGASANTLGLLISEFRLRGNSAQPELDEYIELVNNANAAITVNALDGSGGWSIAALSADGNNATIVHTIPNGTVIPSKGHYLLVNNSTNGYSLSAVAAGNAGFTTDLPDDAGLAIFNSANNQNFNVSTKIDAVGFQTTGSFSSLFREGTGLSLLGTANGEYAWVRRMENGQAIDTNDNNNDFVLVHPTGMNFNGVASVIGAPGPENSLSPTEFNRSLFSALLDPSSASTVLPNQVRDTTPILNGVFGTLVLRRSFTNNTGVPLKKLRFRVIDITNSSTNASEADVRLLSSASSSINGQVVEGLTLETPPLQVQGGGLNATVAIGTITPAQPLAAGATVNVEFKLGVMRKGKYRFFLNIEAAQ